MAKTTIVDIVVAEIVACGLTHEVRHGGKHPKVCFFVQGRRYTYVVPGSTSDHRAAPNCRAGVRRLIRQALAETDLPSAAANGKQRARKGDRE